MCEERREAFGAKRRRVAPQMCAVQKTKLKAHGRDGG
jgi:hypothetical protein